MMLLSQAAHILDGRMCGPDVDFNGVSTDSRSIRQGNLFIALRGEHFDGHEFAANAIKSGAAAAMVNADRYMTQSATLSPQSSLIQVKDTRLALGKLAAYWRKQFNIPLIAITGSNGKTTVKEMLTSILRASAGNREAVLATQGNLNNDIGMPLTLLQLNTDHRYAVIEMGMNHPGEIDYLTHIAIPEVALITNASSAHLQGLGSVEAVAQAKGEIFSGLGAQGTAIINADDVYAPLWRELAAACELLEFGLDADADVSGTWQPHGDGLHLDVTAPQGMFAVELQVPGEHNARNALAATAAACALDIPLEKIAAGLERFEGVKGRLQRKQGGNGALIIDDTYNANPASMHAALGVLAQMSGIRIFVMGDMGELGADAARLHAEIGRAAKQAAIDHLYTLGTLSSNAASAFGAGAQHFEHIEDLLAELDRVLAEGMVVLVKGSRFMKMERIVEHCVPAG